VRAAPGGSYRPGERLLRQAFYGLGLIGLFSGAVNLLVLVTPIYMFQVFDRVLLTFRIETLIYLTIVAAVCIIALGIFDSLRGVALARLGRWWDETARPDLLDALLTAARARGPNVGASLQDLWQVRSFISGPSVLPFFDVPWTPLFVAVIFLVHPLLGVVAVIAVLLLVCFALANDLAARSSMHGVSGNQLANAGFAATAMRNADVVHAMGMQPAVVGLHDVRQRQINAMTQAGAERTAIISGTTKATRIGVQVAMLGLGAYLVTLGELSAGGMIAASIILGPTFVSKRCWDHSPRPRSRRRCRRRREGSPLKTSPSSCRARSGQFSDMSVSASTPAASWRWSGRLPRERARSAVCWSAPGSRRPGM
jgi:ABC-type protease/lipase transport system fused ATPase/permease subunit